MCTKISSPDKPDETGGVCLHGKRTLLFTLLAIPLVTWAGMVMTHANGYTFPEDFSKALKEVGVRVTEKCRSTNASYGAKYSEHKKCQAADIGRETTSQQLKKLVELGFCPQFHSKGTAPHYHVVRCKGSKDNSAINVAKQEQSDRVNQIRQINQDAASQIPSTPPSVVYNNKQEGGPAAQPQPDYQSLILLWMQMQAMQKEISPAAAI